MICLLATRYGIITVHLMTVENNMCNGIRRDLSGIWANDINVINNTNYTICTTRSLICSFDYLHVTITVHAVLIRPILNVYVCMIVSLHVCIMYICMYVCHVLKFSKLPQTERT